MISHIDGQLFVFKWRNMQEDLNVQQNRWDNLTSYGNIFFVLGIDRFTCFMIYTLVSLLKIILVLFDVSRPANNVLMRTIPCGKSHMTFVGRITAKLILGKYKFVVLFVGIYFM